MADSSGSGWGTIAALIGSALGSAYTADRAADQYEDGQNRAIDSTNQLMGRARNDAIKLFGEGSKSGRAGIENAIDFYQGNSRQRMQPMILGNTAAQEVIGQGLTQANNAVLGLPLDTSYLAPRQISPGLMGDALPKLAAGGQTNNSSGTSAPTGSVLNPPTVSGGIPAGLEGLLGTIGAAQGMQQHANQPDRPSRDDEEGGGLMDSVGGWISENWDDALGAGLGFLLGGPSMAGLGARGADWIREQIQGTPTVSVEEAAPGQEFDDVNWSSGAPSSGTYAPVSNSNTFGGLYGTIGAGNAYAPSTPAGSVGSVEYAPGEAMPSTPNWSNPTAGSSQGSASGGSPATQPGGQWQQAGQTALDSIGSVAADASARNDLMNTMMGVQGGPQPTTPEGAAWQINTWLERNGWDLSDPMTQEFHELLSPGLMTNARRGWIWSAPFEEILASLKGEGEWTPFWERDNLDDIPGSSVSPPAGASTTLSGGLGGLLGTVGAMPSMSVPQTSVGSVEYAPGQSMPSSPNWTNPVADPSSQTAPQPQTQPQSNQFAQAGETAMGGLQGAASNQEAMSSTLESSLGTAGQNVGNAYSSSANGAARAAEQWLENSSWQMNNPNTTAAIDYLVPWLMEQSANGVSWDKALNTISPSELMRRLLADRKAS